MNICFWFAVLAIAAVEPPDGNALLARVDANIGSNGKVIVSEMIIQGRRGGRSVRTMSWVSGTDRAFTEYLAPERERGTKMLKLGDRLWTYSPQSDRTISISGHMLRQSVAGSDLSYEDMMEDPKLTNLYSAEVVGPDSVGDRPAWLLELKARAEGVAYQRRRLWVDRERDLILREERLSAAGRLLKTMEVLSVGRYEGRWLADRAVFRDALREGGGTEIRIDSIAFDVVIPEHIFSTASLRR
ncbi:MAG TPA: outer membrane lipoprotein-sorting protein [candidate division WOR-3 bacterium]|uniref:Outer membrane lipoprotein-sorting protein n=1 Tax=candidate division WOR-3 bacterium TaxID=2052148 RepID=A0A7V0T648_UNCW3|nr:outer membrane lipoprotein-sorting protein [candidate division WOR-3 bacterium]